MPEFLFAAKDTAGNTVQGKATADTMTAAVDQVSAMGYVLLHIELLDSTSGAIAAPPPVTSMLPAQPLNTPLPAYSTRATPPLNAPQSTSSRPLAATVPTTSQSAAKDILKADVAKRQKLESELSSLGMAPDEIAKLINANANTTDAPGDLVIGTPLAFTASTASPAPRNKNNKVTVSSLESFAAQLNSANATRSKEAVFNVNLKLPEFRESSAAETIQCETLLRDASMLRRREKYRDAEAKVREALNLTPSDASALELLGDILQGVGRVDEALAAYKRATEADSKRSSAEKKYGDLLMRQQSWTIADPEAVAPNRWLNSILSLCLPGVGQIFNGEWVKATVFLAIDSICLYLLLFSPWSYSSRGKHTNPFTLATFGVFIVTYIVALIDSNVTASRKQ